MRPANLIPAQHRQPREYGHNDPTILRWNHFRTAVRELLADQPSTRSVRACARRMDMYVLHAAAAETEARDQAHKARDAA